MASRFQALMATTTNTSAAYVSASNCARASASTSAGTCPSAMSVISSVNASAARSASVYTVASRHAGSMYSRSSVSPAARASL